MAREAVIATQVAGIVFRIHAVIGDRVERGDLLAELDPSRLQSDADLRQAERDEAEANLEASAASLATAEQALERLSGLRSSAAFSQARFDEAEQEVRRNRGLVAVAEARLMRAEANLGQGTDRSGGFPDPGAVLRRGRRAATPMSANTCVSAIRW